MESSLEFCAVVYTNVCGLDVWFTKRSVENSSAQDRDAITTHCRYCCCVHFITQFVYNAQRLGQY